MTGVAVEKRLYEFDGFRVDPVRRLLLRDGEPVPITPKALTILLILLEERGQVVTKEDLISRVWPGSFVTEANLTQNISALRKALGDHDRRYVVTVPGQGYSLVAEVVERVEEATGSFRIPDFGPGSKELPVPGVPAVPSASTHAGHRRWLLPLSLAALLILAGIAGLFLRAAQRPSPPGADETPATAGPGLRPSIAVLRLRNLSRRPEADWLAPALSEMLSTELAAGSQLRVVSGHTVARARQSLASEALDADSLRQLHAILGSRYVVVGSYLAMDGEEGGWIRLDLRIHEVPSGEIVGSLAEVGSERDLFELVSRSGASLRRALGLAEVSPEQAVAARASIPESPEAARLYAQGLERLRSFDSPAALDLLQRAAKADPGSAVIHAALSQTWAELGYDARAAAVAAKARDLAQSLPREERIAIEARFHEVSHQWARASEVYRTLWTFFPDDIEYGLRLAANLSLAGRGAEALETIAALRRLPAPGGEDPRIDLQEADAARRLSDPATAARAAQAAADKGRRSGESLIVGQALLFQGTSLLLTGRPADAAALFRESRLRFRQAGYPWGEAMALAHIGLALHRQGDLDGAEPVYQQALGIAQRLGNASGIAAQLGNLGRLYQDRGNLDRALGYLERSREQLAEIGDPLLEARVLGSIAALLRSRGDLDDARRRLEEMHAISRKIGSPVDEARALHDVGTILALRGSLAEARWQHEAAYRKLPGGSDANLASTALAASADVAARLGDPRTAARRYDEALATKRKIGDRIGIAQILGWRSRFALRSGDLSASRSHSAEQLRLAEETGARSLRAWALQEKGSAELEAGDLAAARQALQESLAASSAMGEALRSADTRLQIARLELAEERPGDAAATAQQVAPWYRERSIPAGEALALAVLVEALVRQSRPADAQAAAARLRALVARSEDRELSLAVAPPVALADAAGGQAAAAVRDLRQAAAEARKIGFALAEWEARLALGEIQGKTGEPEARGLLQAVREEAESRGFYRIARKAEEILRRS